LNKVAEDRKSVSLNPPSMKTAPIPADAVPDSTPESAPAALGTASTSPALSDDLPVINTERELEKAAARKIPRVLLGGRVFVLEEDGKYHDPVYRAWREAREKREREFMETLGSAPTPTPTPVVHVPKGVPGSVIRDVKPPRTWRRWPTK
jgi:hypothetical protein